MKRVHNGPHGEPAEPNRLSDEPRSIGSTLVDSLAAMCVVQCTSRQAPLANNTPSAPLSFPHYLPFSLPFVFSLAPLFFIRQKRKRRKKVQKKSQSFRTESPNRLLWMSCPLPPFLSRCRSYGPRTMSSSILSIFLRFSRKANVSACRPSKFFAFYRFIIKTDHQQASGYRGTRF